MFKITLESQQNLGVSIKCDWYLRAVSIIYLVKGNDFGVFFFLFFLVKKLLVLVYKKISYFRHDGNMTTAFMYKKNILNFNI